ncbi:hypothetical protein ACG04R_16475 [Roseateles sp. BYS78W]|uniref:Uncharacterized protein n=1 Tax=Pelomonas candidula TaxID=3299025 RepID=A0ABW7HEC9_9BURK
MEFDFDVAMDSGGAGARSRAAGAARLLRFSRGSLRSRWMLDWAWTPALSLVAASLVVAVAAPSLAPVPDAPTGAAARVAGLDPLPFFHSFVDALRHSKEGAGKSCSLYALYGYVVQRTGRPFDADEFTRFRRWAIEQRMFFPDSADQVVDFDGLARRLPEFFGPEVQSLRFELRASVSSWAQDAAGALDAGHVVVALTSLHGAAGKANTEADHVVRLVEAVRGPGGQVNSFRVRDPDSYAFWESLRTVSVAELGASLARPKALVDARLAAIGVSTEVAFR